MSRLQIPARMCLVACLGVALPAPGAADDLGGVREAMRARGARALPPEDCRLPFVRPTVEELLRRPLSPEDAAQVALLLNPSVQATYAELGIARADLLQAGLLKNPELEARVRFPAGADAKVNREFGLTQDILDVFLRPLRRRVAAAELERARLEVGDALWGLMADVKAAWYTLAGTAQLVQAQRTMAEAAELAAELSRRQRAAGNTNVLDYASQQAAWQQARLEVVRTENELAIARERLARLLGVTGTGLGWSIEDELPGLPARDPDVERLESLAMEQRFDVAAALAGVEASRRSLELARRSVLGSVRLGLNTEQDPDGLRVTGPVLALELPIFDRQQGRKAKIRAQIRQGRSKASDLRLEARKEVRVAHAQMQVARRALETYNRALLPLQAEIVAQSQRQYNFMLMGVYDLLLAKQNEVALLRDAIRARKDYWIARTELEKALAGRLSSDMFEPARQRADRAAPIGNVNETSK